MRGNGIICLRLENHGFYEHAGLANARAEANRLAETLQSPVVVYVPVLRVEPPKRTIETPVPADPDVLQLLDQQNVDDLALPF